MSTAEAAHAHPERPSLSDVIDHEQQGRRRRIVLKVGGAVLFLVAIVTLILAVRPRALPLSAQYRTQAVERSAVVRHVSATGRVEPRSSVEVGAQVSGRIDSVLVDFNDTVVAGQVLALFDTDSLDAQAAQARASVRSAQASLRRARLDRRDADRRLARSTKLHDQGIESQESFEAAQSAAALAKANVEAAVAQIALQEANASLAETNLKYTEVRSPIGGIVISRNIDQGQTVAASFQTPILFEIAEDLAQMRVVVDVDEADIGEVKPGQTATFAVDAYPNRTFPAQVTELRSAAQIVQNVVTYKAVLDVDNDEMLLRPGMTASVKIETARVPDTLQVPNAALRFTPPDEETGPGVHTVWVIRDDTVVPLHVSPGVTDGKVTQIDEHESLQEGDAVLVDLTPEGRKLGEGKSD